MCIKHNGYIGHTLTVSYMFVHIGMHMHVCVRVRTHAHMIYIACIYYMYTSVYRF